MTLIDAKFQDNLGYYHLGRIHQLQLSKTIRYNGDSPVLYVNSEGTTTTTIFCGSIKFTIAISYVSPGLFSLDISQDRYDIKSMKGILIDIIAPKTKRYNSSKISIFVAPED